MIFLDRSFWLGLLLSAGSIFVLAHGFLGSGSATTAIVLATTVAVLILTGSWQRLSLGATDIAFAMFIASIAISFAAHGLKSDQKETTLLLLTLLAYPATRLTLSIKLSVVIGVLIAVVSIGTIVTLIALIEQWSTRHGKPLVFGLFDSAPTQFAATFAALLLLLASQKLTLRQTALVAAGAAIPTFVFAASMVRFVLIAMLASLVAILLIGPREQRARTGAIMVAVLLAIVAGAAARSGTTAVYIGHAAKTFGVDLGSKFEAPDDKQNIPLYVPGVQSVPPPPPPVGCPMVDVSNSLEIRERLLAEATGLLPTAGITGIGFEGFQSKSCLPGYPVHNSFLQAAIEFGWPAGLAMIALIALGLRPRAFALARTVSVARFAYCFLILQALMSTVYGRISRDNMLLFALGLVAAVIQQNSQMIRRPAYEEDPSPSANASSSVVTNTPT